MNWAAIESYLRATRGAARVGTEPAPQGWLLKVDEPTVRAFRARSMHLDRRLQAGALMQAVLRRSSTVDGVRLLPSGDPYLYLDANPQVKRPEPGPGVTQRLTNSLAGRVLLDGKIVGSWGRVQADVTISPWTRLPATDHERVGAEAQTLTGPMGRDVRLRWLP